MQFGDYLKQWRGERGWTQPEAAARADIETKDLAGLSSRPSSIGYGKIDAVRGRKTRSLSRGWMLAGLAMLIFGGGLFGCPESIRAA